MQNLKKSDTSENFKMFAAVCALCNDSTISLVDGKYVKVGESTEAALRVLVEKLSNSVFDEENGKVCEALETRFERLATLDFDRDRKSMSVVVKDKQSGKYFLFVKGAPESILSRSIDKESQYFKKMEEYGNEALRTLCVAYKTLSGHV